MDFFQSVAQPFNLDANENWLGCNWPDAENYDSTARVDDGSCRLRGCADPNATNYDSRVNLPLPEACEYLRYGCAVPGAANFDSTATVGVDGSCRFLARGCTDSHSANFAPTAEEEDGSCVAMVAGCTDSAAVNFNPAANAGAACEYSVAGCTQQGALNYNPLATVPTECVPRIEGCTLLVSGHLSAVNFDSTATVDDGSCRYTFAGCTDSTAINFDEFASVDEELEFTAPKPRNLGSQSDGKGNYCGGGIGALVKGWSLLCCCQGLSRTKDGDRC